MTEPQDFTVFWIGITFAYSLVIAMAVIGGKMIDKKRTEKH